MQVKMCNTSVSLLRSVSFGAYSTPAAGEYWKHLSSCSDLRRVDVCGRGALYVGVTSLEDRTTRASRRRPGQIYQQHRRYVR